MPPDAPAFYARLRAMGPPGPIGCVGIDPSTALLAQWGLPCSAAGALQFGRAILAAADGAVQVVKPQIAYFEQFGADGYAALATLVAEAHERGLLVVADAKRGDIGSTSDAYGRAWFGPAAPLRADAITLSPYLGFGSIAPILARAATHDAYVFVVARSSNPEGAAVQEAGRPKVWATILDEIADWSARYNATTVGAVVGATVPADLKFALERLPDALFLAPGIGRQGAATADLRELGIALDRVIVSSSRGVAEQGPASARLKRAVAGLAG